MRWLTRTRSVVMVAAAVTALATLSACGPAERPPPPSSAGMSNQGSAGSASSGGGAGAAGGVSDDFTLIDEPPAACDPIVASARMLHGPGAVTPIGSLSPIADGWASTAVVDSGFLLFDSDGENAMPSFTSLASLDRVAPTSDGLLVASISASGVQSARFDLDATQAGAAVLLTGERAYEVAIGGNGDQALIAWSTLSSVRARVVGRDARPVAPAFELETGNLKDEFSAAIAARGPAGFVIVWSEREPADGSFSTRLAFTDAHGIVGDERPLLADSKPQRALAIAPLADGFALLVEHDELPVVFVLDADGAPKAPGRRLLGVRQTFDLAVFSDEIMVSVVRDDHRDALRRLGPDGRPKSGWICLAPPSTEVEHSVSVSADSLGFAAIHRAPDGSQVLVRP